MTPFSHFPKDSFECRVRDVEGGEAGSRNGNGAAQDGEPRSKPDRREAAGTPNTELSYRFCMAQKDGQGVFRKTKNSRFGQEFSENFFCG